MNFKVVSNKIMQWRLWRDVLKWIIDWSRHDQGINYVHEDYEANKFI